MGGFRKPVHHRKDGGVAIRRREALDEVQGYIVPWAVRDRKWLKEASRSLPRSFILGTNGAGSDERGDVRNQEGNEPIPELRNGQSPGQTSG